MDIGIADRTVVVTGASGGIGFDIASLFAQQGSNVVAQYHNNRERAHQLEHDLGRQRCLAVAADLTDETAVENLFQTSLQHFGPIQHLVCNAGIWPPHHTPIVDMQLEQWQNTLNVNLTSVFLCCRTFLRQTREQRIHDPSIVFVGSTAGIFGEAGHADYASAKSGFIYGLMNSLKNEIVRFSPQGRVNTVSPGWVLTPMTRKFAEDKSAMREALATIALNKVATTADIANAVLFLSSSKLSGHITGQNLVVSGGMEGRLLNPVH
ncbi:MAG TPA: SDR family NAD(P)-dependent oxidoreductase [Pirellulaceae bacterium]|nr:SDR family NAD(P)-dependent oxidoreductase [Pirellulaceae bacterium]HMO92115.1 SDR family NAD(P)-dependent oxidoreductase [Pirellulaceae bacterium]HMP69297.1 SDR family NAD(P)-dependent oxidoreductase [Pirellulaceae bacterium]